MKVGELIAWGIAAYIVIFVLAGTSKGSTSVYPTVEDWQAHGAGMTYDQYVVWYSQNAQPGQI